MDPLHKLAEYFSKLPGIGPRQSRRFVYFLLEQKPEFLKGLADIISGLKSNIELCKSCFRFFPGGGTAAVCPICNSDRRDHSVLMVVERDVDFESVEKSGAFKGRYFILGGSVPILEKNPENLVRSRELLTKLHAEAPNIKELVLAMNLNTEGEHTIDYLRKLVAPLEKEHGFSISTLGRGLSTGTELEYSDSATLANAFKNRK